MNGFIHGTVRLIRAVQLAYTKKWSFFGLFAVAFMSSVVVLAQLDLLPDGPPATIVSADVPVVGQPDTVSTITETPVAAELPLKIAIAKINLSVVVANPTVTDTATLDAGLLKGAVRYPSSAKLGETGNVVLFGHSSYLPIVNNQAYKTFNEIQKLKAGDVVTVYASLTAYTYRVRSVTKESAMSDQGIALDVSGQVLTLVTCNSFGTKEDRFVVVADFVDSHSISN